MDFTLDELQNDVRELARGAIGRRAGRSQEHSLAPEDWFDRALWTELAQSGLLGMAIPEEDGGSGTGFLEQCLVLEEAARAAARLFLVESVVLAALPLARYGTADQRRRLVTPFCAGDVVLTSAIRTDGTPAGALSAARGDGGWNVRGSISHVPLSDVAERVLITVADESGRTGYLLLDPQVDGVTLSPQSSVDRAPRWHLDIRDALVTDDDVVIAPGQPTEELDRWVQDHGAAARCVSQLGHGDAALQLTASHVTEREQFGRPVGTFQAVAHRVADAYIDVTAIRLTTWRAVWLLSRDQPASETLAIAAWWAADAAPRVGEAAMHLHGGASVDMDYPLHRHYLAIKQNELALGGPSRRLQELGDLVAVA
jgi:alkylation response protein AidB-like acyl-CoA dehydrogenase